MTSDQQEQDPWDWIPDTWKEWMNGDLAPIISCGSTNWQYSKCAECEYRQDSEGKSGQQWVRQYGEPIPAGNESHRDTAPACSNCTWHILGTPKWLRPYLTRSIEIYLELKRDPMQQCDNVMRHQSTGKRKEIIKGERCWAVHTRTVRLNTRHANGGD